MSARPAQPARSPRSPARGGDAGVRMRWPSTASPWRMTGRTSGAGRRSARTGAARCRASCPRAATSPSGSTPSASPATCSRWSRASWSAASSASARAAGATTCCRSMCAPATWTRTPAGMRSATARISARCAVSSRQTVSRSGKISSTCRGTIGGRRLRTRCGRKSCSTSSWLSRPEPWPALWCARRSGCRAGARRAHRLAARHDPPPGLHPHHG
jgi:hypothetical protein